VEFFVGIPDSEVLKLLNFFTFLPQDVIEAAIREHNQAPEKRIAQHLLAREFVELVHGPEEAQAAYEQHTSRSRTSTHSDTGILPSDLKLPPNQVIGESFAVLLKAAGLAESKAQAMRLIDSGGAYVNRGPLKGVVKIENKTQRVETDDLLASDRSERVYLMLRVGKWKSRTIEIEPNR
jgi:tyrosyl-tRNA synthetase